MRQVSLSSAFDRLRESLVDNEDLFDNLNFIEELEYRLSEKTTVVRGAGQLRNFYSLRISTASERTDKRAQGVVNMVEEVLDYIDDSLLEELYSPGRVATTEDLVQGEIDRRRKFLCLYIFHYILKQKQMGDPKQDPETVVPIKDFGETDIILKNGDILKVAPRGSSNLVYYNNHYKFMTNQLPLDNSRYTLLEEQTKKALKEFEKWENFPSMSSLDDKLPKNISVKLKTQTRAYRNFLKSVIDYAKKHKPKT